MKVTIVWNSKEKKQTIADKYRYFGIKVTSDKLNRIFNSEHPPEADITADTH